MSTPYPNFPRYRHVKCECGCSTRLHDGHHDEDFCLDCGCVVESTVKPSLNNVVYGSYSLSPLVNYGGYTFDEHRYMKSRGRNLFVNIPMKEYRRREYKFVLDCFKGELCLSGTDLDSVWYILNHAGGLKQLHSRLNYEAILLGVCRYVLIHYKHIKGRLVDLRSPVYREYCLTRGDYLIIERNILKYVEVKECNT